MSTETKSGSKLSIHDIFGVNSKIVGRKAMITVGDTVHYGPVERLVRTEHSGQTHLVLAWTATLVPRAPGDNEPQPTMESDHPVGFMADTRSTSIDVYENKVIIVVLSGYGRWKAVISSAGETLEKPTKTWKS